jgi:hypothetical protein
MLSVCSYVVIPSPAVDSAPQMRLAAVWSPQHIQPATPLPCGMLPDETIRRRMNGCMTTRRAFLRQ